METVVSSPQLLLKNYIASTPHEQYTYRLLLIMAVLKAPRHSCCRTLNTEGTDRFFILSGIWLFFSDTIWNWTGLLIFRGLILFFSEYLMNGCCIVGKETEIFSLATWGFVDRNNKVVQSILNCWWDSQQSTFDYFKLEPNVSYLHHVHLWRINLVLQKGGNCLRICYTGSQTASTVDVTLPGIKAYVPIFNSVICLLLWE